MEPLFQHALRIQREIGDRVFEGKTLRSLGLFHLGLEHFDKALDYLERALAIHRDVNDPYSEIRSLFGIADVHADCEFHEKAFACLREALEVAHRINYELGELLTQYRRARYLRRLKGDFVNSRDELNKLIMTAREKRNNNLEILALSELGHLMLAENQDALPVMNRAKSLLDKSRIAISSEPGQAYDRLLRSIEAYQSGLTVYRGECVDNYSSRVRDRLNLS